VRLFFLFGDFDEIAIALFFRPSIALKILTGIFPAAQENL
jgi:hypothetical protein